MTNRQFEDDAENECVSVNLFTPRMPIDRPRSSDRTAYAIMAAVLIVVWAAFFLHR